jgi:hypothetical protein
LSIRSGHRAWRRPASDGQGDGSEVSAAQGRPWRRVPQQPEARFLAAGALVAGSNAGVDAAGRSQRMPLQATQGQGLTGNSFFISVSFWDYHAILAKTVLLHLITFYGSHLLESK